MTSPPLLITAIDTVGAGDAFVGAFAAGSTAAATLPVASPMLGAGALSCLVPGAQPSLPLKRRSTNG